MVIFSETSFQNEKMLSDTVLSIMNQKKNLLESIIKKGQKHGTIKQGINYKQLAIILMGSMRMTILRWRLSNFDFNLVREGAKVWAAVKSLIEDKNCAAD